MTFTSFLTASSFIGLALAAPQIGVIGSIVSGVTSAVVPVATSVVPAIGTDLGDLTGNLSLGFVVNQLVPKPFRPGPVQLAAAFAKYGAQPPADVKAAAANSLSGILTNVTGSLQRRASTTVASGSVTASPEPYDQEYLCPVTLGGQTLNLDLDTGSADLWVFSSELAASSQTGHDIYNPTKSTTSKKLTGQTWKIQYGDGSSASGDVYSDNVKIGGSTVTSQAVEAAQSVSAEFQQDTDCDGLVGLSFSTLNQVSPTRQNTFFDTAISQGLKAVFTANLKKGVPGSYGFGQIDSTQYTAAPTYVSADSSQGYWGFTAAGYGIGTTYTQTSLSGIVDTGTSLMALPGNIVTAYWNAVSGASYDSNYGAYTFPCTSTLPNFFIGLGSAQTKYTVPGSYMNFAPLGDGSGKCYGGLQSSDGMGINIFGDIFLKAFFVIFDKTTASAPRLGFATKKT